MEWRNIYRGLLIGATDLIPGVSGGTLAIMLGIYDRLLEAISGFFSREWKRHIGFLIPLAVGMGTALILLSRLIKYLLAHHYEPTQFFFVGLIIGIVPFLLKQSDAKRNFSKRHIIMMLVAVVLAASLAFLPTDNSAEPITSLSFLTILGLFFSGWLASMAMLLPGISGSFVLLLLGVYPTAIHALSELNVPLIATIGAGVIIGFIVSSKGIRYLLSHYSHTTYAVIIGLIFGSVAVVFPGFPSHIETIAVSAVTFVAGLSLALAFGSRTRP
ncbi:DUF368 domain-containing protein [Paenibacillus sp. J2TS4]|uniref:DUF368 domain-containing protein n=1 Tax=Paenibacillus sp. J2TS4 TaxID=2807194 RepID=UPI001B0E626A|nr:DUF368 domain-containing protein [Paenibacillus sp. J2TS4]GIP32166.1 DUF368 domain-containing protein [Paenibacillus sp. J2TS4]